MRSVALLCCVCHLIAVHAFRTGAGVFLPTSTGSSSGRFKSAALAAGSARREAVTALRQSTAPLSPPRASSDSTPCVIKVLGVGGAGGNAVKRMQVEAAGQQWPELWAVNTDVQALNMFKGSSVKTLHIGEEVTRGLGAGSIPANGRLAAESSRSEISKAVENSDLVFITAGMGGGTGSGAAPVVAEMARKAGALTIGIVTKPFSFEGRPRKRQALEALRALKEEVDTLITVSNDRLLRVIPSDTPVDKAFSIADEVLRQAVVGVSDIIMKPGLINVDFADVKAIMNQAGKHSQRLVA
jgi:cell division protein FtsZ